MPDEVEAALPVIADRCRESRARPGVAPGVGPRLGPPGRRPRAGRRQRLRDYEGLGLSRTILQGFAAVTDDRLLDGIADDAAAVGLLS